MEANGHDEGDGAVDLAFGLLLRRVDILLRIEVTDEIADPPGKNRAVVPERISASSGSHGAIA